MISPVIYNSTLLFYDRLTHEVQNHTKSIIDSNYLIISILNL